MFHLTSTMFKSAPNIGDVAKDNPDLMKEIAKAMAKNMVTQPSPPPANFEPPMQQAVTQPRADLHPIPKMEPPNIDILSKIMPGASADQPIDAFFTQSLANTFQPPKPEATKTFDDTKIVEITQTKKNDPGKIQVSLDDNE